MTVEKDIEFIFEVGTMRHISRTWSQFGGLNFANLAEHTLRVMWISTLIAKYEKANIGKVLKLSLVHDLGETRVGDAHHLAKIYTQRNEDKAIEHSLFNTVVEKDLHELWNEYKKKKSLESKIVKDADNLDCDFELQEIMYAGAKMNNGLVHVRKSVYKEFFTETAKKFYKKLKKTNPNDWYSKTMSKYDTY